MKTNIPFTNNLCIVILMLFIPFSSIFGQGLNFEKNYNNAYTQVTFGTLVKDQYSYIVVESSISNTYSNPINLIKMDTSGTILFEVPIRSLPAEVISVEGMVSDQQGNIIVAGSGYYQCDVGHESFQYVMQFTPSGEVNWVKSWQNFGDSKYLSGLTIDEQDRIFLTIYTNQGTSVIYEMLATGSVDHEITVAVDSLTNIYPTQNDAMIASRGKQLLEFNATGITTNQLNFASKIQSLRYQSDTVFVLTSDSLFFYSPNLSLIDGSNIGNYSQFSNLRIFDDKLHVMSVGSNNSALLTINRDFTVAANKVIQYVPVQKEYIDYNAQQLSMISNYNLTSFTSVRLQNFSLVSTENAPLDRTDAGIINFNIDDFKVNPSQYSDDVYNTEIYASVLIKNFGNHPLYSCRVNYVVGMSPACGYNVFSQKYDLPNLAPGDSIWITLGLISKHTDYNPSGIFEKQLCIYTSDPNSLVDLTVPNDKLCKNVYLGTLEVENITQDEKKVVKIVDVLGRETQDIYNQVVIYIYEDGTTKKMYQIKN